MDCPSEERCACTDFCEWGEVEADNQEYEIWARAQDQYGARHAEREDGQP